MNKILYLISMFTIVLCYIVTLCSNSEEKKTDQSQTSLTVYNSGISTITSENNTITTVSKISTFDETPKINKPVSLKSTVITVRKFEELLKLHKYTLVSFYDPKNKENANVALCLGEYIYSTKRDVNFISIDVTIPENEFILRKYNIELNNEVLTSLFRSNGVQVGQIKNCAPPIEFDTLLPSPNKDIFYSSLQAGLSVLVTVYNDDSNIIDGIREIALEAKKELNNSLTCIYIKENDLEEKGFINYLRMTGRNLPLTYVINAKGQITTRFTGSIRKDDVIEGIKRTIVKCGYSTKDFTVPEKW